MTVTLDVCLDYSIEDLKQLVQLRVGTPVDQQVLTFSSKGLVSGSLAANGIEAEATLNLSGRLRGGPALPPSSLHQSDGFFYAEPDDPSDCEILELGSGSDYDLAAGPGPLGPGVL